MKRSARVVDLTYHLLTHPQEVIPLSHFAQKYGAAKSSISEDLSIIKEVLEAEGRGELETLVGATGGVRFVPLMGMEERHRLIQRLCEQTERPERILPGGYLYLSDLIGDPKWLFPLGRVIATAFAHQPIDCIMTIETKGIPLAYATSYYLRVPVIIVRRNSRVTEGSYVSINYISGSSRKIQTMSLARRSLNPGANVLVVDDFMKAGGTVRGMAELLQEFQAHLVGVAVFVEAPCSQSRLAQPDLSILRLAEIDEERRTIRVIPGRLFPEGR